MAKIDKKYKKLLNEILVKGFRYEDPNRKGITRIQIPSYNFKYNFKHGFPAMTTKKLYWKGIVGELLWFLKGDTNIKYLIDNKIHIWNKDAYNYYLKLVNNKHKIYSYEQWVSLIKDRNITNFGFEGVGSPYAEGPLGRVYGAQWRNWTIEEDKELKHHCGLDQISNLIKGLKENPMGTRHIVTAWNPAELDAMALPPCHWSFEILVEPLPDNRLKKYNKNISYEHSDLLDGVEYQFTLKWHQRSVDTFLGLPFNIASYALLAQIIGKMTNMIPKGIEGDLSNVHIYENHLDAVKEQLSRDPNKYGNSELGTTTNWEVAFENYFKDNNIDLLLNNLNIEDVVILNNGSYPAIKAEMLAYNN